MKDNNNDHVVNLLYNHGLRVVFQVHYNLDTYMYLHAFYLEGMHDEKIY